MNELDYERRELALRRNGLGGETPLPTAGPSVAPLSDRTVGVALGLILAVVFLSYLDTLWFQFVLDDRFQIVDNTWLRSWRYLPRYFTGDVWSFLHPTFRGNLYRPLFLLWLRIQYIVFGLNPWGWHFCTVLAHVAVTALVYCLSLRLLQDRRAALFATLIFGLHPVHAEAVAWISGVTEPILALLLIASFLYYLHGRTEPFYARGYLAASLVLYLLATLAKETALVLPMIIFASELIWSGTAGTSRLRVWLHRGWAAFAVTAPYLAISGAYMGLRVMALHGFQNPRETHRFFEMVLTWPSVLWFYIQHLLWPVGLGPFYDVDYITHLDVRNVLLPTLIAVLVAAGLWVLAVRSRRAALAILWLILPILPVLNLIVFNFVHDRYLYLPSIGFAMLVGMGLGRLQAGSARILGQPAIQVALAAVLTLGLATRVSEETAYFATSKTFFTRANSMSATREAAKANLAGMMGEQGHLEEAIKMYEDVWPTQPNSWQVNYNLGYAYYLTGKFPEADRYLSRAAQIDATLPDTFFYLGLTKLKLGDIDAEAGNVQRALTIRPDAVNYHFVLGVICKLQGNLPAALIEFHQEMDLNPDNAAARQQAEEIEAGQAAGQKAPIPGSIPVPSRAAAH